MGFCGGCGKKAELEDKFCTSCGTQIKEAVVNVTEEVGEVIKEEFRNETLDNNEILMNKNTQTQTTKYLGNKLEEAVEKIFIEESYETKIRQKILGQSNVYSEIDVIATKRGKKIAIECKNYSPDRKVGIKEIRDFLTKLVDLEIEKGVFVTSSYFSGDAMKLAENNPQNKILELWDQTVLNQKVMSLTLGRNTTSLLTKLTKIENSLPLETTIKDQSLLHLKNQERISIVKRDLAFLPVYITAFNLHDEFRAPDKHMYSHHNEGAYYVDGLSGKILFSYDKSNSHENFDSKKEKQMVLDLQEFEPRMIEVPEENNSKIIKLRPGIARKDVEFQVRNQAAKDNRRIISYKQKIGRGEYKTKKYPHMPHHFSIQCQTRIVYVPELEIEFESGDNLYKRSVMMSSGIVTRDEISICKHLLGTKTTFAVCDVCGMVKCEKDITLGENDDCYCKKHIPEELKNASKGDSITDKLKKFSFKRK